MNLKFDKGYAGVLIVVLSIMASIGFGYVMNIDEVTYTKENHEHVADITGLFDQGTAPEYIEYNPSANYTGYHNNSDRNNLYFGGVEYTASEDGNGNAVANNYPLRFRPIESADDTFVLSSTLAQMSPPTSNDSNVYWGLVPGNGMVTLMYKENMSGSSSWYDPVYPSDSIARPNVISVKTLVNNLNVGNVDAVLITIPTSNNSPIVGTISDGAIKQVSAQTHMVYTSTYTAYTLNFDPNVKVSQIYVDLITETCNLIYEDSNISSTSALSLDYTYIAYGGVISGNANTVLSNTIVYHTIDIPSPQYLDVTKGVKVEGGGTPARLNTVRFIAMTGGSVSRDLIANVPTNAPYTVNGASITLEGITVTATPISGYTFQTWTPNTSGTVSNSMTFTASFLGRSGSGTIDDPYTNIILEANEVHTLNGKYLAAGCSVNISYYVEPNIEEYYISGTTIPGLTVGTTPGPSYGTLVGVIDQNTESGQYTITVEYEDHEGYIDTYEYTVNIVESAPTAYSVAFAVNGNGTLSSSPTLTVDYGTAYTINGNSVSIDGITVTATPSEGYVFNGWNPPSSGIITSNTTFVASFGQIPVYNIRFEAGSGGSVSTALITATAGTTYTVNNTNRTVTINTSPSVTVTATANDGYLFSTWTPNSSGTITGATTFTASFLKNYTYTLIYNDNTGTGGPGTETHTDTATQYQFIISSIEPTKVGYTFLGWSLTQYTPGTGTAQYGTASDLTHTIRNSSATPTRTLYAVWQANTYAAVNFNVNSGPGTLDNPYTDIRGTTDILGYYNNTYISANCHFEITACTDSDGAEYVTGTTLPGLTITTPGQYTGGIRGDVNGATSGASYTITTIEEDTEDTWTNTYTFRVV